MPVFSYLTVGPSLTFPFEYGNSLAIMDDVVTRAFGESFWLGIAVLLTITGGTTLWYVIRRLYNENQRIRQEKDAIRDRYEEQQREDLKLFVHVQSTLERISGIDMQKTLSDFNPREIRQLLSEINTKIERLLMLREKS